MVSQREEAAGQKQTMVSQWKEAAK